MKEEWRPIPLEEYSGLYEVSNTGKVRSISRVIHKNEPWHNRKGELIHREFDAHYQSVELKPYVITKKGKQVKYHLHKRIHSGYYGQSDAYVYAHELVQLAFPELSKD